MNTRNFIVAIVLLAVSGAAAQEKPEPILPGRPDVADGSSSDALGAPFESLAAGILFRPPANSLQIKKAQPDEIVQYVQEKKGWTLKVSRLSFSRPVALATSKSPDGTVHQGIIDLTLDQIRAQSLSAEVLRQETMQNDRFHAGMITVRYSLGGVRRLTQEALVQASEQLYYVFNFTTNAAGPGADPISDPTEHEATDVFRKVVDSIQILDREAIRRDQEERLFRTRSLLLTWSEAKLKSVLIPEQWIRLQRDGKDIGYTYVVEESSKRSNHEGILIGLRSRTVPDTGMQVDAESWLFCSGDRRYEEWNNAGVIDTGKPPKDYFTEFGTSDRIVTRVLDRSVNAVDPKDPKQPPVRQEETYSLHVTRTLKSKTGQPFTQDLPPFYLPQALGNLLPRLLPLNEPKSYLFASYVGERQQVMFRYIDVEKETTVNLAGQSVRAIPVRDRLGLEGSATTSFMSPDGKFLGSVNEDQKITMLPSDAETLTKFWKDADLTRPKEVEKPNAAQP